MNTQRSTRRLTQLVVGVQDIEAMLSVLQSYQVAIRRLMPDAASRTERLEVIHRLRLRGAAPNLCLLLTVQEIILLDQAFRVFVKHVRVLVPPSHERDETLQDCERLRRQLVAMLSSS